MKVWSKLVKKSAVCPNNGRRHRVFVTGKVIFTARELLGALPLRDDVIE